MTGTIQHSAVLEEDAIKVMSLKLRDLGFEVEEGEWLNPLPDIWSVQIRDKSIPWLRARGKGMSQSAALVSAYGEFFERLSCNYFFKDLFLGQTIAHSNFVHYPDERWFPFSSEAIPEGLLDEATLSHYNMDEELTASMLVDTNSGHASRGICALPFFRQKTGEQVWFPVNILSNLYASNGMAAGKSEYEARVNAISEIFERHIKITILSAGISLPKIPYNVLQSYPKVLSVVDKLRAEGFVVYILDASLGGKFPLVNVTLLNPEDGGCIASFGAHPKFAIAFERAVTELLQSRELSQLSGFAEPSFDLQRVADQKNLEKHVACSGGVVSWELLSSDSDYPFVEWNVEGAPREEFEHLCYLIHKVDMDIYIADYQHLGVPCCRVVVPGMSEIYPVEKLIKDNNNAGMSLRMSIFKLAELDRSQLLMLSNNIELLELDDKSEVARIIGIQPAPKEVLYGLRMVELKLLLALALSDQKKALDLCERLLYTQGYRAGKSKLYRCLHSVLVFECAGDGSSTAYEYVLEDLYGAGLLGRARAMCEGKDIFVEFELIDMDLRVLRGHSLVLEKYRCLQKIKSTSCEIF